MSDDGDELARRLESFRNYLLLLARVQLEGRLPRQTRSGRPGAADLDAGLGKARPVPWQRRCSACRLAANALDPHAIDAIRKFNRPGVAERSLEAAVEQSSERLEAILAADQTSPSGRVERQEQLVRLAERPRHLARRPAASCRAQAPARPGIGRGRQADGPDRAGGRGAASTRFEDAAERPGETWKRGRSMSEPNIPDDDRQRRLEEAMAEYLDRCGRRPAPRSLSPSLPAIPTSMPSWLGSWPTWRRWRG